MTRLLRCLGASAIFFCLLSGTAKADLCDPVLSSPRVWTSAWTPFFPSKLNSLQLRELAQRNPSGEARVELGWGSEGRAVGVGVLNDLNFDVHVEKTFYPGRQGASRNFHALKYLGLLAREGKLGDLHVVEPWRLEAQSFRLPLIEGRTMTWVTTNGYLPRSEREELFLRYRRTLEAAQIALRESGFVAELKPPINFGELIEDDSPALVVRRPNIKDSTIIIYPMNVIVETMTGQFWIIDPF